MSSIRNYVNCTLVASIAIGMLFAAISDAITEKGRVESGFKIAIPLIAIMAIVYLQQVFHDEILEKKQLDTGLFVGGLVLSASVIFIGTALKWKLWSDSIRFIDGG